MPKGCYPRPSPDERFEKYVKRSGACLLWTGATDEWGYGYLYVNGCAVRTHRFVWARAHGPIPDGVLICHTCDIPNCVELAHLFEGTDAINAADKVAKGRSTRGEKSGTAKLTEEQVGEIRSRYASGEESMRQLAFDFGVACSSISRIVNWQKWTHPH